MDSNTLSLYLVAAGVSISLSLVLMVFAYLRPGTRLLKSCAAAILMLSVGFWVSGYGPALPRWMTVMGTNMVLISAGAVLYSGFSALHGQRPPVVDRFGWAVTALTALPFWYWGLIEPNGNYRSAVFSFATAAINARTAWVLVRAAMQRRRSVPAWVLATLFGILVTWMAVRGALSLLAQAPAVSVRGANPTAWTTVLWYIVLVSMMSVFVIWLELGRTVVKRDAAAFSFVEYFLNKLHLLWVTVLILVLAVVGETGLFYAKSFEWEQARLTRTAELTNDAFVHHSIQVVTQVDTLLQAVRGFYLRTRSLTETEQFINTLPFDKANIENIYLISEQGRIVIAHDPQATGRSVLDRDYFAFHQANSVDQIYIGAVDIGRVSGRNQFRVTRRINHPDGSFAGVVLANLNPESFSRYYRELTDESHFTGTLLGTRDRKLRARTPEPPADRWQIPIASPLWDALARSASGSYKNTSMVDEVPRLFTYRQVGDLPLVMVTGFSEADIKVGVQDRSRWVLIGALTLLLVVLVLAALLTVEIRRRNEQDNFMSMLNHELKTPLSVLRIALEQGTLSASTRAYAQQSVQDMDTLIYRCLQVDRLQQGQTIDCQACQINELLTDLQTASTTPQRLQIESHDLPLVHTDPQLLRIALNNLVDNALKYAPANSTVHIKASRHLHHRRTGILVSVSNEPAGAGRPDAHKVFKKYYRSPGAHSKTGSGLGLYLVHSMARLLGGWVSYAPDASHVRFELWLPTGVAKAVGFGRN